MSDYSVSLNAEDAKNYSDKLTLTDGEKLPDPYDIPEDQWSADIKKIPNISSRDVTEYLINTPSVFTKENMKAYKSLEAYDYFICRHVQACPYFEVNLEFCFIISGFTKSTTGQGHVSFMGVLGENNNNSQKR